ncbi:MAG: hypothetical protein AAFS07_04940 [Pseudomonadota bacterium]
MDRSAAQHWRAASLVARREARATIAAVSSARRDARRELNDSGMTTVANDPSDAPTVSLPSPPSTSLLDDVANTGDGYPDTPNMPPDETPAPYVDPPVEMAIAEHSIPDSGPVAMETPDVSNSDPAFQELLDQMGITPILRVWLEDAGIDSFRTLRARQHEAFNRVAQAAPEEAAALDVVLVALRWESGGADPEAIDADPSCEIAAPDQSTAPHG